MGISNLELVEGQNRKRILIVEDEFMIALATMSDLTDEGYDVVISNDGEQGLETASHEAFDLIITDFMMPKMNGIDMINALRSAGQTIPIVLTSSINQDALPRSAYPGYDRFLPKPYRARDICALARYCLADNPKKSADRLLATGAGPFNYLSKAAA